MTTTKEQTMDEKEQGGTFACRICGKDSPHHHTRDEVEFHDEVERWADDSLDRFRSIEAMQAELTTARATIAQQGEELARMREALAPMASAAEFADERMVRRYGKAELPDDTVYAARITLGDLRRARQALESPKQ